MSDCLSKIKCASSAKCLAEFDDLWCAIICEFKDIKNAGMCCSVKVSGTAVKYGLKPCTHAHRVAVFGHAKHSQNRRLALRPSLLAEHLVRLADDVIDVQLLKNCSKSKM